MRICLALLILLQSYLSFAQSPSSPVALPRFGSNTPVATATTSPTVVPAPSTSENAVIIPVAGVPATAVSYTAEEAKKRMDYFHTGKYEEVQPRANMEKKGYFVDFVTDWCRVCKQMEREVFAVDTVRDYAQKNYIAYQLDAEERKDISDNYSVSVFPTIIFFDFNGKETGRLTGYVTPEGFVKAMNEYKPRVPNTRYSSFR